MLKLRGDSVGEKQAKVANLCVGNIAALMKKSRCERPEVLPISEVKGDDAAASSAAVSAAPPAPLPPVALDPTEVAVKAAIANTVAEQYRKAGRIIAGDELTAIVNRFVSLSVNFVKLVVLCVFTFSFLIESTKGSEEVSRPTFLAAFLG